MLFKGMIDMIWLLLQGCIPADHDTVCGGVRPVDSAQFLDDAMARPPSWAGLRSQAQPVVTHPARRMLQGCCLGVQNGESVLHRCT